MTTLVLGLIIWMGAHFFKRLAPNLRQSMGKKGRLPITLLIVLSVVLMVIGFRSAPETQIFAPVLAPGPLFSLLMLFSLLLFGAGKSGSVLQDKLRHPMLYGLLTLSVLHVLVNGDIASIILFGGLGLWSILQITLINKAEGAWARPAPGNLKGDAKNLVISLVVFAIATIVHVWTGHSPFPAGG